AVPRGARTIVDIGTGTGALAKRCLVRAPRARIVGIDNDGEILAVAARRLGSRATFVTASFLAAPLPRCDAIVSSFALHHVRTRGAKLRLYRRFRTALRRGGCLVSVDRHPSPRRALARKQTEQWKNHLRTSYSSAESTRLLAAWGREDVYVP